MGKANGSREVSALRRPWKMPLQHGAGDSVGLLQIDAPVFQFVERYPRIGHRAAHVSSRRDHAEIAIQILHLGFAMARGTEFIQHGEVSDQSPAIRPRTNVFPNAIYHK